MVKLRYQFSVSFCLFFEVDREKIRVFLWSVRCLSDIGSNMLGIGSGVELFVGRCKEGRVEEYLVTIDWGKSLEEMIFDGRYDWKINEINEENFPVNNASKNGIIEIKLELVHMKKGASTKEVEVYLEENGLRAATLKELLAFGATYPEVQLKFPIIAIGSSCFDRSGNNVVVPYLGRFGAAQRFVYIHLRDKGWIERCRFLAVRK